MFNRFFLLLISLFVGACSGLNERRHENRFVINRLWARHTPKSEYMAARINHTMSPSLFEDTVIVGNEIDSITAYHQKTGRSIWSRQFSGGVVSSAVEYKGSLYFGAGDGFYYALNAKTGRTLWAFPLKAEGLSSPLVTEDAVYLVAGNNSAYALKRSTGEQIWFYSRVDTANLTVRGASEPSIVGDKILMGFSDGYIVALDRNRGTWIWERQIGNSVRFRDIDAKPVVDGDRIFISSYDGQLYCLRADNGQTIWTNDEGGFTPVTVYKNRLYYASSTRKVLALEKSSGRVIWSIDLKNQVASQPQVARGLVVFGEWGGSIRAVEESSGKQIAAFNTGRGVTSRVTFEKDQSKFYVISADAVLYALKLELLNNENRWPWEI